MSKLYRARSLLYRRQILQQNIRWKALDEIYKIYMLLHRSDLNILANFRQIFSHFSANFAKFRHFRIVFIKICSDFDENLSEFRQILSKMLNIRCSSSKTSNRIRKCVFHLPSLVEPERLTGSDKWAMPETRANLIVVRPLLARAPLTAKLISRAT